MAAMETRAAELNENSGRGFLSTNTRAHRQSARRRSRYVCRTIVPISGGGHRRNITWKAISQQPNEDTELNTNVVGLNFFNTMGIPIVAGRDFNAQDKEGSPRVVIVNEELARRYYGGNAVGKRLQIGSQTSVSARSSAWFAPRSIAICARSRCRLSTFRWARNINQAWR